MHKGQAPLEREAQMCALVTGHSHIPRNCVTGRKVSVAAWTPWQPVKLRSEEEKIPKTMGMVLFPHV